jgi:D-alanyl-D-alanine carboxypeptidase (penicillin-binding protein 5/6)
MMKLSSVALLFIACSAHAANAQAPIPNPAPVPTAPAINIPPPPTIGAKSYVLMDFSSGQILASNQPDLSVEPASITKIMTSYVVSAETKEGKITLNDPVFISENAWRTGGAGTDGSTSFLELNSKVSLSDLLHGMIIQSGNDASIALAEHVAGDEATFANLMNEYAKRLGLTGTHYVNSTGLPADGHVTTARDIAKLSQALIRDYPEHYPIYAIKEFTYNGKNQPNRNALLWRDPTIDGIKTGHTSRAGYCLTASAKRDGLRLIAVVMGTSSEKDRANEAQALLNYGFRFFESHSIYAANATIAEPALWKGQTPKAKLGVQGEVKVTIPRGSLSQLAAEMDIPKPLLAPLTRGQPIGTLRIRHKGQLLLEAPIIALQDYPLGGFFSRMADSVSLWWSAE